MRVFLLLLAAASPEWAQHTLYVAASNAKGYVVGAKLAPSGVFRRTAPGAWQHLGFNHPFTAAIAARASAPDVLYLAAGNGLIRMTGGGGNWKILTGNDVTELRDAVVDERDGSVYFTHTRGISASSDGGKSWRDVTGDLRRKYVESVRVDRSRTGVLVAATESGLFRSEDGGGHWVSAGASSFSVLRVEQSPATECLWLATTELGGLFSSKDCGRNFESTAGRVGVDRTLYDLAWDPLQARRVAVAGFHFGVAVSDDEGATWEVRNQGLPSDKVWSVAFDPDRQGRMFASVHEEAVYVSDDAGLHWRPDGLPGSAVSRFTFVRVAR